MKQIAYFRSGPDQLGVRGGGGLPYAGCGRVFRQIGRGFYKQQIESRFARRNPTFPPRDGIAYESGKYTNKKKFKLVKVL